MKAATALIASLIAAAAAGSSPCSAETALMPGAYAVDVHLEMSFGEDKPQSYTVCLTDGGGRPAHGLFILTPGTPLSHCPVQGVHEAADRIAFEIVCAGPNAGTASADYRTTARGFEGRIAMLMGGKNMRMTEVQVGHRTGECAADGASRD